MKAKQTNSCGRVLGTTRAPLERHLSTGSRTGVAMLAFAWVRIRSNFRGASSSS